MAETQQIVSALNESLQALGLVDVQMRGAMEHADLVVGRMAASGFGGVAAHVNQVRQMLEEAAAIVPTIAEHHQQASTAVGQVSSGSTPEQVVSQLSTVQSCIAGARQAILHMAEVVDHTRNTTLAALQGGAPGELVARITAALEYLTHAYQVLDTANQATATQITTARQAGN